jgi:hypothetical protein
VDSESSQLISGFTYESAQSFSPATTGTWAMTEAIWLVQHDWLDQARLRVGRRVLACWSWRDLLA